MTPIIVRVVGNNIFSRFCPKPSTARLGTASPSPYYIYEGKGLKPPIASLMLQGLKPLA